MKNYLGQGLGLTALVCLGMIGLYFVPDGWQIGNFTLRRMDVLYDIRPEDALSIDTLTAQPSDTLAYFAPDTVSVENPVTADSTIKAGPLPPVDSMFFGSIIEDYTPDQSGLHRFFAAIDSIKSHGNTVRVAFYGDSFIEGDILVGDLRDTLQTLWGGAGVGFVPITSEVARFKRTLQHNYRGWNTFSVVKNREAHVPFGLNGSVYFPQSGAFVQYMGARYFHHTQFWRQFRLFYSAQEGVGMQWARNTDPPQNVLLPAKGNQLQMWSTEANYPGISNISLHFSTADSFHVYGAALEDGPGIYFDNFSVRGNTGGPLMRINPALVHQFDRYQQYDLVILQVGLNAVSNSLNNLNWYRAELDRTYAHLRSCFPGRPILIISLGDRGGKVDGRLATMRGVPYIVAMQRDLARKHGFLFYDLFHGMGGPGVMIAMANEKPMLANKDYTHLTHEGGRQVGYMFARLFLAEQRKNHQQTTPQ